MDRESVKSWCNKNEPPYWAGLSTAYRSGAAARADGKSKSECNYKRENFAKAWIEGFDGMDKFLLNGGVLLCDCCGQELRK